MQTGTSGRLTIFGPLRRAGRAISAWLVGQLDENKPAGAIATLDGVRAIACLTVVAYHISLLTRDTGVWSPAQANPLISAVALSGFSGVTLFFVLSGFLLFMPYAKSLLTEQPWPGAGMFYLRRALRILPGYYFSLFILVMFDHPEYLEPRRWHDLFLFGTLFMDSAQSTFRQLNGPYWTLAVEWQFYLLLPWIALAIRWLAWRLPPQRRLAAVIAGLGAMMAWGLVSRAWGYYFMTHPAATFVVPRPWLNDILFFTYGIIGKYLEDFAVGMLAGLLYIVTRDSRIGVRLASALRRVNPWLWALGLGLLLLAALRNHSQADHYVWPWGNGFFLAWDWSTEFTFALGYGCLILGILYGAAGVKRIFAWAPLRWVGLVSYSLYIWHLPVLIAFKDHIAPSFTHLPDAARYGLYWAWALLVAIPFAGVLYVLVEKPAMRFSDRLRQRRAKPRDQQPAIEKASVEAF